MRALLGIFLIASAAALQAAGAGTLARLHLRADFLLVSVLSISALTGEGAALIAAAGAGMCKDALSAGPFGLSSAVFAPLALLACWARPVRRPSRWAAPSAIAFAGTLAAGALYALFAALRSEPAPGDPGPLLACAAVNACIAPPLYWLWRAVLR